ncbi:MAG: hypothetical protein LBR80_09020 [Deltaproteobacteria bacterium]|jgi:hypothetical protein|nr:hypothetical protein [Deltaproteobacteria bacterium]
MDTNDYEKLLAEIAPLDLVTLTRLEADLARLRQERQAEKFARRRPIMEFTSLAIESLGELNPESYWDDREKELGESRTSWADRENELDRERRP